MTRRALATIVLTAALLGGASLATGQELQPHMAGWESVLTLDYGPVELRGKPALAGTVTNISPYDLTGVRLLVDTLDHTGRVTNQQVAWVPGDLRGGGRLHFSVPTTPAPAYRVRVYTYDRMESRGDRE
jgi:hypothetical protein